MNTDVKPNILKPRWSKVFTDLWNDKTRTGLVVASIAVGTFAIGMIISAYVILSEDVNRSYASINPPNIEIWTDPFDIDLIRVLERVPEVKEVEGRRLFEIRGKRGNEKWQNLTLVGQADFSGGINILTPIEGTQYPGDDEVIISQDVEHISGYHPGDKLTIELPDGSTHNLTVVGLVTDQTTSKTDASVTTLAYVSLKTLRSLGEDDYFNRLYITVKGDGGNKELIASVAIEVTDAIEDSRREVYKQKEMLSNEHPMTDIILAIIGVLVALGSLITILSSSLIINTLNALLAQQLRQIGIMKLVGGRSLQILGMYLTLIIAYGLIALFIAVPLATVAGYGLAFFLASILGAVLQGFRVIPAAVITQVLIAILIPLGTGLFPVINGVKTKIQQAISNDRPNIQGKKKNIFDLNTKWFMWIPRPILLSFRNTFRKWGRLLLTIFTLTVAGAVFIGVFNTRDSIIDLMQQLVQHLLGDVTVSFYQPYKVSTVEQTLLKIPGVIRVEPWGGASGEIWDENDIVVSNIAIAAPPQDTQLLEPDFVAGRWLLPDEEKALVMSDTIYLYYPDIKPGDKLLIKLSGHRVEEWTVVGIFRYIDMLGDPIAYADFDYFSSKMHMSNQSASYRVISENHDLKYQQELTLQIERLLVDRSFDVYNVESGYIKREMATVAVNVLVTFLLFMAVLTAFVGSIGLTGTMSINVLERTREIGVMRTIGAVDRVIMQSVIIEALVIGLITWVLAIGLSFPISSLLLAIINKAIGGSAMAQDFTLLGIVLWLVVVIILSIIASLIPARNAARLTINEVLAYE